MQTERNGRIEKTMRQQLREILFEIELIKRKQVQEFLLGIGLTPGQGQARILVFVDTHPDVTQREIADACMLDVTTMSRCRTSPGLWISCKSRD